MNRCVSVIAFILLDKAQTGMTECAVCLVAIDDKSCTTSCGHVFHSECIFRSLRDDARCPMCRTDLMKAVDDRERKEESERAASDQRHRQAFMNRRRREENKNALLSHLRDAWLGAEILYNETDLAVESVLQKMMQKALSSSEVKQEVKAREKAKKKAHQLKTKYKRMLEDTLGVPPNSLLNPIIETILQRHVRARARMDDCVFEASEVDGEDSVHRLTDDPTIDLQTLSPTQELES